MWTNINRHARLGGLLAGAAAAPCLAGVDLLYSNSGNLADPFVITAPGAGCEGRNVTALQNVTVGLTSYGGNADASITPAPFALADDFTVPTGQTWTVTSLTLYFYENQIGGTPAPTVVSVGWALLTSSPAGSGTLPPLTVATTAGGNLSVVLTDVNKALESNLTDCLRRIQRADISISPPLALSSGTYWLVWSASGAPQFTGPWTPFVVVPGQPGKADANALLYAPPPLEGGPSTFQPLVDPINLETPDVPQDLVFVLNGSAAAACAADVNDDDVVDDSDLGLLLNSFGLCPGNPDYFAPAGELAGDPCVTDSDLGVLLDQFGCDGR